MVFFFFYWLKKSDSFKYYTLVSAILVVLLFLAKFVPAIAVILREKSILFEGLKTYPNSRLNFGEIELFVIQGGLWVKYLLKTRIRYPTI